MQPPILRSLFACLLAVLVCSLPLSARAADDEDLDEDLASDDSGDVAGGVEVRGMDCVPQASEVELRRPIPIACETDDEVKDVQLRYRLEGIKTWSKLKLKATKTGHVGEIPCTVTARKGVLKVYVFARGKDGKIAGRVGKKSKPMNIQLKESSDQPPPALPNQDPPDRCFSESECPPEMLGSASCPGTKKGGAAKAAAKAPAAKAPPPPPKPVKAGWGGSCGKTSECAATLACIAGTCETPPKCTTAEDCTSGECSNGICQYPDPEELATRLGPPMNHWIGLHLALDILFMREAKGVCGEESADSELFECYDGGDPYEETVSEDAAGDADSKITFGTRRLLLSYEYAFGRLAIGGRLGWAFGGAPKDFNPLHFEGRFLYALKKDPLNTRFRPYLGLSLGYARVDAARQVKVLGPTGEVDLDAYRIGSPFFFGPVLSLMYAFNNEAGLSFNLSTMLPMFVLEPSVGYVMAL